ncbi:VanZ family protein [Phycicoccus badiiscoriae]|uniref:VanZ family protein n=1 Tax=Pedococcus badiiscoriae TaxID=642776 RepID=A0A852WGI0_9MICO|nr:VanZ family protein [Pedococcus badiiscoriae]NYG07910.1 VanZ family protein [Pedococcus badiiscoriae]
MDSAAPTRRREPRPAAVVFVVLLVAQALALYWPRVDIQGPVTWTDKVVHVLLFLLPTLAGLLAGFRPAYVVGLLAVHAPVSELIQHYLLPHRSGDVWDAVADLSGVVVGVTVVVVGRALRR